MSTAPVSARRKRLELSNGKHGALVRPANYEEISKALTLEKTDRFGAHVRLFDAVNVEKADLPPTARFSLGLQVVKFSGRETFAEEVSEHKLPDDLADILVARREKDPSASFVCLRLTGDDFEPMYFLLREPDPSRFESYTKAKANTGGGIDADLTLIKQHAFHGDLEALKREAPIAIMSLANALAEAGGVCFEATVGEA